MNARLVVDEAGRIALPQLLREEFSLGPGDSLELESVSEKITLRPLREGGRFVMEQGVAVFRSGGPITLTQTNSVLEEIYREREQSFLGPGE